MMKTATPNRTFCYDADVRINYEVVGHGDIPVVFLHGFAAALTTWHDIRGLFPPERFRLYLLDLKGFGFSTKPRNGLYRPEDQAVVVIAFLKSEGLGRVVLVGHSLGGGIALLVHHLSLTGHGGELVGRLVLIDCAVYPQRLPRIMGWLRRPLLGWSILNLLPLRFMVRYTLRHVFLDPSAITPERMIRYMNCFGRRGAARVLIATCRQLEPDRYDDLTATYRDIAIPTLIIWGREDRIVRLSQGERLAAEIPGARLAVLDHCGHIPHEEQPEATWAVISEFLDATLKIRDPGSAPELRA